jgi:hypothetical protein
VFTWVDFQLYSFHMSYRIRSIDPVTLHDEVVLMMWPPCTNTLSALNQLSHYIQKLGIKFHKREIESSSAITLCPLFQLSQQPSHTRITAYNVYRGFMELLSAYKRRYEEDRS